MQFDRQPDLRGDLLALRPLRPDDFAVLYAVAADPLIWEQHPEPTRHREEVFRAFFDAASGSGGALVAVDLRSGRVIGSSDKQGAFPATNAQTPENMAATIYHSLGLPDTTAWFDQTQRPHHIYYGSPIEGL